jgi:hypothetical protein
MDSKPNEMSAKLGPRELSDMGDCVALFLDTYLDKQNAFLFQTNALGVQYDARVFNDGSNMDESWDGVWRAEGRLTSKGWFVEIRIPFCTLRLHSGPDQTWGFQAWRYIERLDEVSYWVPVTRTEGSRVSNFGTLEGIECLHAGINLQILPYGMARGETSQSEDASAEADAGVDLKWGLTPSTILDATVNPDFGQIEADPEYINLSRYEYYLREKRPFFLEGEELLLTPFSVFYSRRIGKRLPDGTQVPLLSGARLTGKMQSTSFVLLGAATEGVRSEFYREPPALYSAGRVRWDLPEGSNIGVIVSGRDTLGGYTRCTAFDAYLRFFSRIDLVGEIAKSWDLYPDMEGNAGHIGAYFRSANWTMGGSHTAVGKSFRIDDFGYVPWYGMQFQDADVQFNPMLNSLGVRLLTISFDYAGYKREEYPSWTRYGGPLISTDLTNAWTAWVGGRFGREYEAGEEKPYTRLSAGLSSDSRRAVSATLTLGESDSYNYRKYYFGRARADTLSIEIKPATNIQATAEFDNIAEYREDGSLDETAWTASQHLRLSLTRDLHLRLYVLENTDAKRYTGNGLIEWEFAPMSKLYLAFNEIREDSHGEMVVADRIGFVKISYMIDP